MCTTRTDDAHLRIIEMKCSDFKVRYDVTVIYILFDIISGSQELILNCCFLKAVDLSWTCILLWCHSIVILYYHCRYTLKMMLVVGMYYSTYDICILVAGEVLSCWLMPCRVLLLVWTVGDKLCQIFDCYFNAYMKSMFKWVLS